ncbi:MAG TPA: DUF2950 domain-containing protein [Syntrophales bacterium]|nr:DUF2950 domain-containing protein [Syntrophorhabdaceae bacterium]HVO66206.1 DUF2950 domain-containing protein [Syntrophales bacterium]
MKTSLNDSIFDSVKRMVFVSALLAVTALAIMWILPDTGEASQRYFTSPEDALKALVEAVKSNDAAALDQIFGPARKELISDDEVQHAAALESLAKHLAERTDLVKENESTVILHVGNEKWPFPIPIVKKDGQWLFDTEAGKEEILNRRIGENELTAILVCRSYVKAQREYALKDWEDTGVLAYAQKLRSDPGRKNGLFWRTKPGEEVSPLGELVAQAWKEGYKREKAAFRQESTPFHGYYFRILTRQGENAPGGKYNYVINGNMVAGFAMVAFPSNWNRSGVMTFVVNQQGKVYQKNLGPETTKIAQEMKLYDPDRTWTLVKE